TMTSGTGTCTVKYDQAGNANFSPATQVTEPVTATKAAQAGLLVTAPTAGTFGQTYQITTSGGSSSGSVSFDVGASTGCALNGSDASKLDITKGSNATCAITATKAGDDNYLPVSSAATPVGLHKADQTITLSGVPAS